MYSDELQELETLLNDPEFYIEEYCAKIQNEIDIKAEEEIIKANNKEDEVVSINNKREQLLNDLKEFQKECKNTTTVFNDEIDEMKIWIQNLTNQDSCTDEIKVKLNECKKMLHNYKECIYLNSDENIQNFLIITKV